MPSDDSWNLKGLKPELRETAREAARKRGLSVAEWLQSVIKESAKEKRSSRSRTRRADSPGSVSVHEGMAAIGSRLDELAEQLDEMARAKPKRTPERKASSATNAEVSSALRAIEGRLAALSRPLEKLPVAETHPLNEALARLDQRLERLTQGNGSNGHPGNGRRSAAKTSSMAAAKARETADAEDDDDWTLGIDDAVAEIAERQRLLDDDEPDSLRDQFSALARRLEDDSADDREPPRPAHEVSNGLREQLRTLTDELQSLRRPGGLEQAMAVLREELANIGRHLSEAAPLRALQALDAEVHAISERVDQGRQQAVDKTLLAGIERSLDEVRTALRRFAPAEALAAFSGHVLALDKKIEAIAARTANIAEDSALLRQLERSVAELREIAAHAASGEALIALAEEVQAIGDKVERFVKTPQAPDLSALIDRRFRELSAHLETKATAAGQLDAEHVTLLVDQLAGKLDRLDVSRESSPMLDAIARQITRLTEHAEAADARLDHLDHFEQTARELLRGMDELRASAAAAAQRAAEEAVREAAQQSSGIDPEFLRSELQTLRQGQVHSDRRTQDTLEAVHDTLERLVERLATVEQDVRLRPAEPVAVKPIEPSQAPSLAPAAEGPKRLPAATAEIAVPATTAPERRPIDPSLPADHPLEPGTAPRARQGSAAERIAASEAALGPARPASEGDAKSNFIAAARRAAQAAAANVSVPNEGRGEPEKSSSAFGALAQRLSGRKPLLLGMVLLVAAGALHLIINGVGTSGGERAKAPEAAKTVIASAPQPSKPVAASSPAAAPSPTAAATSHTPPPARTAMSPMPSATGLPAAAPSASIPTNVETTTSAPPAEGEPKQKSRMVPTVSPLTIASIQIPRGEVTGAIGRATGLDRSIPAAPAAVPVRSSTELPASFEKGLRTAALTGNPVAAYEIATRFVEGRGVALNFEEALRWFTQAADHGLAPAQYRLGSLYEKGQGTKKDLEKARALYRGAADKGNAKAMHNLAVLYAEGIDGRPDYKAAAEWFRKAATRGVADSQYNLGILHARGLGADQNLAESYKWFALAAQQGDKDAGKKRDDVAARLDQQALVAARLAVQTFVAEPQPEEATTVKLPQGGWDSKPSLDKPKAQQRNTRKTNRS